MGLDTDALMVAGTGAILTNSTLGTAAPTRANLESFANTGTLPTAMVTAGWKIPGAISRDDLPAPGRDGGDVTSKRIWNQVDPVRSTVEARTDFWDITAVQIDNEIFYLYYGGGTFTDPDVFVGPAAPAPIERAVVIMINDGGKVAAQWNPRMSIIGTDEIELDDEEFTAVPLRFTRLAMAGQPPFKWIGAKFGTPAP